MAIDKEPSKEQHQPSTLVDLISQEVKDRFILISESGEIDILKSLAPDSLIRKDVIRLQRIANATMGWRTLIIAAAESPSDISKALEWSASCKEELLDPDSSDLYLFIIGSFEISIEECVSIEANEKFCRKFVLRPEETLQQLLKRTFIPPLRHEIVSDSIIDPLTAALSLTAAADAPWLTSDEQKRWQKALLSNLNGPELVDTLFTAPERKN